LVLKSNDLTHPLSQVVLTVSNKALLTLEAKLARHKTMSDQKWIVSDKEHLGGKPRVNGTRISIAFLLDSLANGMSVVEIVEAYPTLNENAV